LEAISAPFLVVIFGGEVDTIKTVSAYLEENSICIFIFVSNLCMRILTINSLGLEIHTETVT
jgi:hypothetical protein